ncbi:MAG TPA: hypothetical protein VFA66_07620 [Gaiellaceae bacterium]|nr:hypothetical protein [Gaiellaceae bacterium]
MIGLIVLLALLAALFVGLGFVIKWMFILAIIFGLAWLISMFAHGIGRSRA